MKEEIESFYERLKSLYSEILRIRSRTISTRDFKERAITTYETWKTNIEPMLRTLDIESDVLSTLDNLFDHIYEHARIRVANISDVRAELSQINDIFLRQILVSMRKMKLSEPDIDLMESASFLGLDTNWSLATCALQLQEVAVTLVAKRKGIFLDKRHVEAVLNKKIKDIFFFNDQYDAFSRQVKSAFDVEMPKLTKYLRRMRVDVLHGGYNPKPEETKSIVSFTIGLLKKLENL